MKRPFVLLCALFLSLGAVSSGEGDMLFEASLRNGDYGEGSVVPTMDCVGVCPFETAPHNPLGIEDSFEGVTFLSTEANNQSNALINWDLGTNRMYFKSHGTVSFWFKADSTDHVSGEIFGDNFGYEKFCNGQITFGASTSRLVDGGGPGVDVFQIGWRAWFNAVWYDAVDPAPQLAYDQWYQLGFAWGGPVNDFEIWVNGELVAFSNLPPGVLFPWGQETPCCPNGINFGIGQNHQRGCGSYNSVAGATFADIRIWDEYRSQGDTISAFMLLYPPDGGSLSEAPPFGWTPGDFNYFLFISVFDYGVLYPYTFWLPAITAFDMPGFWFEMLSPSTPHYWAVLGVDTFTLDWEVTGPWTFTKGP